MRTYFDEVVPQELNKVIGDLISRVKFQIHKYISRIEQKVQQELTLENAIEVTRKFQNRKIVKRRLEKISNEIRTLCQNVNFEKILNEADDEEDELQVNNNPLRVENFDDEDKAEDEDDLANKFIKGPSIEDFLPDEH